MDDEMDLQSRVFFVNSRWIETNRTLEMSDLVNHCRAELELKQRHLAEAEQLAEELGADASLSDQRRYQWMDLRASVGSTHARWIAGHPNATVQELLEYLEAALDQCEEVSGLTVDEALEEMGCEFEVWLGTIPDDVDLSETLDDFHDSISDDLREVFGLSLIVADDFKVSDLPKPRWMIEKLRKQATTVRKPKARKTVLV